MSITNTMTHDPDTVVNASHSHLDRWRYYICRSLLAFVLAGLVSGCAISQDYQRPQVEIPNRWIVDYQAASDLANTAWWEYFQDPVLNQLIQTALNENKDLRIAAARVEEFAGRLQAVQSGLYPQINYGSSASYEQQSLERAIPSLTRGVDRSDSTYHISLNAGWELDIWGRIRRATEAARADLLSEEEGRQAAILMLVSAVASGYIDLLHLDKQLEISRETLASREEWVRLFENKIKGGQISELELAQVRSEYEQAAAYIPTLELRISLKENSLSVLLGRNPGRINRGKTLETLAMPEIPQGIPSDLLTRRPDIRQREQNLIAANARIGVVRTQYFPTISLTGLLGFASKELSHLLQGSANFWQAGAGAIGSLFSGGRIKSEIRQAEARQQQLINDYLSTIQTAFREVDDSLVSIQKLRELLRVQDRHIKALKDYAYYARSRYDAGYSSYLEVLDAERHLYSAKIMYARTQNDVFASMVSTYKAMGGGWTEVALIVRSVQAEARQ